MSILKAINGKLLENEEDDEDWMVLEVQIRRILWSSDSFDQETLKFPLLLWSPLVEVN